MAATATHREDSIAALPTTSQREHDDALEGTSALMNQFGEQHEDDVEGSIGHCSGEQIHSSRAHADDDALDDGSVEA
jgi:hypothetical protein